MFDIAHLDNNTEAPRNRQLWNLCYMYICTYYLQRNRFFGARGWDRKRHSSSGQASWCSRWSDSIVHLQQTNAIWLFVMTINRCCHVSWRRKLLCFLKIQMAVALTTCEFFRVAIGGRKYVEGEIVGFFARYLLPSMGNWATGRADMSSRHHARQSTRVIHCISELSEAFFSLLSTRAQMMRKLRRLCRR